MAFAYFYLNFIAHCTKHDNKSGEVLYEREKSNERSIDAGFGGVLRAKKKQDSKRSPFAQS